MKIAGKVVLSLALAALSVTSYAYDDPQTDHDSLYFTASESDANNQNAVDIAALEAVSDNDDTNTRFIDPQTDYDSVYMTDYLESLENQ